MSKELSVSPQGVAVWDTVEGIAAIKQTVAKGATDAQLIMFLNVARATELNPFLREIWFVAQTGTIMAGRDGYLAKANRDPNFDGMETKVEWDKDHKLPVKATCTVWRKDRNHPITMEAYWSDYAKDSPVWKQYKAAMISKCAEVLALKRSFAINGVVTEEEISVNPGQPIVENAEAEVIEPVKTEQELAVDMVRELFKQLPESKRTLEVMKGVLPISDFGQVQSCSLDQLNTGIDRLNELLKEVKAA